MESLIYTDPSGRPRHFYLRLKEVRDGSGDAIEIQIWPTPEMVVGTAPYYARFACETAAILRSEMLDNNGNPWAIEVGLSEALFTYVDRRFAQTIISSRGDVDGTAEWQSGYGRAMWQRFVRNGLATYDQSADQFTFVPPPAAE